MKAYPLEQTMIETYDPWPFEGLFIGKMTHTIIMNESIREISKIKKLSFGEVSDRLWRNTISFYDLEEKIKNEQASNRLYDK